MNLRDIKKDIEYVIGAFIDDCSLFSSVNPNADDEVLGGLLDEAVNLYNDLRDKVNVKITGKKAAYFANLRKELLEKTDGLYKKLSVVVKETVKEEKKVVPEAEVAVESAEEKKPTAKKPAVKKPAAKKPAAKKPAAEKPVAEEPAAKKPAAKKPAAEKPVAKKPAAEKPVAEEPAAKKSPAKKAAPKTEKKEEEK
jgi:flagellar biosynthesis GTPase FlhF